MWLAAAEQAPTAPQDSLIIAIFTFLGVVVTTVGVIVVQAIKSRAERTAPAPPAPTDTALLMQLAREQGQLVQRNDDSDQRDDLQDRRHDSSELRHERSEDRLDALERWADRHDGGWRQ